jgi:hypothetical protein
MLLLLGAALLGDSGSSSSSDRTDAYIRNRNLSICGNPGMSPAACGH